jgi:hypothetical protein
MEIKLDVQPFFDAADRMNAFADQVPFALSRALNDAAYETYQYLIEDTWPQHVKVRNSNFLRWALRTKFSTKYDLRVEIYDHTQDQRAHLALHASGGTKTPKGSRLAIPTGNVRIGAHGVRKGQRPRDLQGAFVKGNALLMPVGKGRHRRLKAMYVLAPRVQQPADVPFQQDFETMMRESAAKHFPQRMMEAMRTRK